ncbi:MAG: MerR family transcriptional regulator mercuric resistance operon regulatory protein [Gammaproteobacteria bacterium]|nr:MAG: MerR family transcriptional regulator mercuric resistance operon regulatory protein [Gammaproteobacteria bacterium]TND01418.1 MAG: MerR family transcriptional regulator, mercuric resistance operon regulatory protein [Gammaproteobacteria bacterium]
MKNSVVEFTIGELAGEADCKVQTIRFYEQIGILPNAQRTDGGHRVYGREDLRRLHFVRRCRGLGFSLDQIRVLLTLVDGGAYTCGEVLALTLEHLAEIQAKLADLKRMEQALEDMAAQCKGGTIPACPVIDVLLDA